MARSARVAAVLVFAAAAAAAAQEQAVIAVQSGGARQVIARMAGDQWQPAADAGCTAVGAGAAVITGAAPLQAPVRLTPDDEGWRLVRPDVERLFEQRQREHQLTAANVPGTAMTIDWVFAAGEPGPVATATVFYVEASRRVPDPGTAPDDDPRGTLRVTVSGWLRADAAGVRVLGSKTELRWEQERDGGVIAPAAPDLEPLGIARQTTPPVWVMKAAAGSIVRILLYEVSAAAGVRTMFEVRPARC